MSKIKCLRHEDFHNDRVYHVELAILKFQEEVAIALKNKSIRTKALGRSIGMDKRYMVQILRDGNCTIKTFAKIMFELGYEINFKMSKIKKPKEEINNG